MILRVISYSSSYLNLETNLCSTSVTENISILQLKILGIWILKYGERILKVICTLLRMNSGFKQWILWPLTQRPLLRRHRDLCMVTSEWVLELILKPISADIQSSMFPIVYDPFCVKLILCSFFLIPSIEI